MMKEMNTATMTRSVGRPAKPKREIFSELSTISFTPSMKAALEKFCKLETFPSTSAALRKIVVERLRHDGLLDK
jgi:hypothetical protein